MKLALQITSWVAVVVGVLAIISGLSEISSYPTDAYYSLLGGVMFGGQGLLALIYINEKG
jgi:hypothetical protein